MFEGDHLTPVQRAFSKQSLHYDEDDASNPILIDWRNKVYRHFSRHIKSPGKILELNAGTGIDATHFVNQGHTVVATDISPGMISQLQKKALAAPERFMVKQCAFEQLDTLGSETFDCLFSNFGGLNCCIDLSQVGKHLPALVKPGGFVVWVIMPPVCPWEILSALLGKRYAFRRFTRGGSRAHLEGEYFQTYYYSLKNIRKAVGKNFELVDVEGLGALSPPPSSSLAGKLPAVYKMLRGLDRVATRLFPFNRWADHIIVTFRHRA